MFPAVYIIELKFLMILPKSEWSLCFKTYDGM